MKRSSGFRANLTGGSGAITNETIYSDEPVKGDSGDSL